MHTDSVAEANQKQTDLELGETATSQQKGDLAGRSVLRIPGAHGERADRENKKIRIICLLACCAVGLLLGIPMWVRSTDGSEDQITGKVFTSIGITGGGILVLCCIAEIFKAIVRCCDSCNRCRSY